MTLFSGCSDWLDVNVDPENPTAGNATYDSRLAHIEFYTNSATQFAAWRSSMSMGDWTRYYDGGTYWNMSYWPILPVAPAVCRSTLIKLSASSYVFV